MIERIELISRLHRLLRYAVDHIEMTRKREIFSRSFLVLGCTADERVKEKDAFIRSVSRIER